MQGATQRSRPRFTVGIAKHGCFFVLGFFSKNVGGVFVYGTERQPRQTEIQTEIQTARPCFHCNLSVRCHLPKISIIAGISSGGKGFLTLILQASKFQLAAFTWTHCCGAELRTRTRSDGNHVRHSKTGRGANVPAKVARSRVHGAQTCVLCAAVHQKYHLYTRQTDGRTDRWTDTSYFRLCPQAWEPQSARLADSCWWLHWQNWKQCWKRRRRLHQWLLRGAEEKDSSLYVCVCVCNTLCT